MNDTNTREVVGRILRLVAERTTEWNPSSDDIDLERMFCDVCEQFPDIGAEAIVLAFDTAHRELIEQHLHMAAAEQGTRH
jgi:hypothetical protein